ncbi:4'-phosphopantetheinyl transferase superfamily protein [Bifidobacterium sp. MA2]|uniref:4'-phosphopantetheinyl transferase superfamily protein n=1 Tax=Bifidobacterium santillanense TaxID=2809028 RepID=A0ABS5UR76_9BIFI|nr:4'-phosphopantetheinyl transferase superfamily protein [Bifidobacterium santillanense]MBT1173469.1 4'-phosphopantetheinyl transferase superfamily protein [Bifidobacterium santillanense]
MSVLGLGHDVVDVAAFGEQLAEPGSRMRGLFSVREVRQAATRARLKNDGEAVHLAAKWAGKEAFLKAWCEALGEGDYPFTLDDFPWSSIEVLDDSRGVPHVTPSGEAAVAFRSSMAAAIAEAGTSGSVISTGGYGRPGSSGSSGSFGAAASVGAYMGPSASASVDPAAGPYAVMRAAAASSAAAVRRLEAGPSPSPSPVRIHLSLSHDGPVASAVVILAFD